MAIHAVAFIYPGIHTFFHAPHTTNTILIIMLRKGWQKIIKRMNAVHRQMHVREPQILGPHSSVPNTNGFLWVEMVEVDKAGRRMM